MRNAVLPTLLLLSTAAAANLFERTAPFADVIVEEIWLDGRDMIPAEEVLRRQNNNCGSNCANLGQPGVCCKPQQVCSADAAGHIGCCPLGAACTGTLNGPAPTAVPNPSSALPGQTSATTTGGFSAGPTDVTGDGYTPSTVQNPYYPFAYIPTTYNNAAACSSAYTSCQTDVARCTSALAGNVNGVTVNAPNGGVTVAPVTARLDVVQASSVCQSLSSQACYLLQVEACARFGDGTGPTGGVGRADCRGAMYGMGAGVAIGVAGQML